MARRLPSSLRVAAHRVGIGRAHNLHGDIDGMPAKAFAVSDVDDLMMWFERDMGPERTKTTFMHEVLHMYLGIMHIHVEDEEAVVTQLAPLLIDFIRNNKAAVAYMQEV